MSRTTLLVVLLLFSGAVTRVFATTACSAGFTGSVCQYHCSELCRTHTTCTADRCDVPRCQCNGYGSIDQASGQCVCDTGRSGDRCEFAISETVCSQSQSTGRFSQPSGTSTCPDAPAAATAVCVNGSMTYPVYTRGAFEWPSPYPCFPPISDSLLLWPVSIAAAYVSQGKRDELSVALHTEFFGSLRAHTYGFAFVPYSWSSTDPTKRVYTIHSSYEHSRTLEADPAGPDTNTGRIRVFLSPTRLANPTTWYACTVGPCFIMPVRFPGYGLNVNMTTRNVFVNNETVLWTVVSNVPLVSSTANQVINRTLTTAVVTVTEMNLVDCLSHAMRAYSKRAATFYTSTKECDLASSPYFTSTQTGVGATTYVMGPDNSDGRLCGSRDYNMPNDLTAPDSKCTKKYIGPARLVYGGSFGGSAPVTTMLVADTDSSTVRMRNLTHTPSATEYFFWNITDETGNGGFEVTISVAFLSPSITPLCLAIDDSSNVLLLACDPADRRTFWFMDRSTVNFTRGFNLRPALFTEASGVALEVEPGSGGFNIRVASGHPANVLSNTIRWTPWFRGVPASLAGRVDGFSGMSVTSFEGSWEQFDGLTVDAGTYDRAHCISLCASRQPDCVAAKIDSSGVCSIWKFDDSVPSPSGRLEHALFTQASSTTLHYIMDPEPFKSLVQRFFPPHNNSDCAWQSGYFAVKGGTLGTDSIGASLFSETKYRNGYYCINSLDVGPILLANVDFDDASIATMITSNSRSVILDTVVSTSASDIAELMFVVLHATGEPFIYTIHNAMAEEMTLEADLTLSSTATSRRVVFSRVSRGSPMKWKLNTQDVYLGVPLTFEAYDLPGWFMQIDAPLGTPPAAIVIKRDHGRGYGAWFAQYGLKNGGNLGQLVVGAVVNSGFVAACVFAPDNIGDVSTISHCFFNVPYPGMCLTMCAYQQDCYAINYDALSLTCQTLSGVLFSVHGPITPTITGSGTDVFAYFGNGWYTSRCLVDNYVPLITSGIGLDTNSAETWLRAVYAESKCKRRVLGPFLLFERTEAATPHKIGARYNVGDFGTPDATKHYEIIDCLDPAIPFDYELGCNDGITISPRSLFAFEQVAYDQYYVRLYWKTLHGAETQASKRYLFVDPSTNELRVTDFGGYHRLMVSGVRKYVHDGRQYVDGNSYGAAHGASVRITLAGDLSTALTLNNVTHRVTMAAVSAAKRQSWSMIIPGFVSTRWKYSHKPSDPQIDDVTIGTIEGVVEAAHCALLCWANKRCEQATHNIATAQCVIKRKITWSGLYLTNDASHTTYSRQGILSNVFEGVPVVYGGVDANQRRQNSLGLGVAVSMYFGNIGTCSGCFTGPASSAAHEAEGGFRPAIFQDASFYTDGFPVGSPIYKWLIYLDSISLILPYTGWLEFDRQSSATVNIERGTSCYADSARTSVGRPNWCCQQPSSSFSRYFMDSTGVCGATSQFTLINLPVEYNDFYPRTQLRPAEPASVYRSNRGGRYAIVVYSKGVSYSQTGVSGSAQTRPDQFLCMSSTGLYFSNDQYDPNCVVYVAYTCTNNVDVFNGVCPVPA